MDDTKPAKHRLICIVLCFVSNVCGSASAQDMGRVQQTTTKTMETYVPKSAKRIASIELSGEAVVNGSEVTLRQICRWPEADADAFADVAGLVVVRFGENQSFQSVSIDQVQTLLRDAGVNPGLVNFAGAAACTVSRSDVQIDDAEALRKWVGDHENMPTTDPGPATYPSPDEALAQTDEAQAALLAEAARQQAERVQGKGDAAPAAAAEPGSMPNPPMNTGDLRARLIYDIATRLNVPATSLQIDFKPEDRKVLSLREPFEFSIDPQRYGDLGETSWLVGITSGAQTQKVRITASARAWTEHVVVIKPLGLRQTITEADIEIRRVLADRLSRDPLATKDQIIGQQAARDLKPGVVLTSRMLAPVELVRSGQLVTVLMRRGAVEVKSVAVALQSGSDGQTIKVKNEKTNEIYQVILTGRQTAVLTASDSLTSVAD
jgi:flagella basal body P-ring formation protein FlgA